MEYIILGIYAKKSHNQESRKKNFSFCSQLVQIALDTTNCIMLRCKLLVNFIEKRRSTGAFVHHLISANRYNNV